ncbi:unnamed protein product, partial [Rotaria magnacalcarata]
PPEKVRIINREKYLGKSATSEYLTSCIADLGKTRSGELALGLPNRPIASDYSSTKIICPFQFNNNNQTKNIITNFQFFIIGNMIIWHI